MNSSSAATRVRAQPDSAHSGPDRSAQQTGRTDELNRSEPAEELLPLLSRFMVRWEQDVVLGDHRWQSENMKAMQRFAKGLSKEFLTFDSRYPDLWDREVREQVNLFSNELRQFVTPDMRRLSVQDNEVMVAHGRMAYELTRGLISHLVPEKVTGKPSSKSAAGEI